MSECMQNLKDRVERLRLASQSLTTREFSRLIEDLSHEVVNVERCFIKEQLKVKKARAVAESVISKAGDSVSRAQVLDTATMFGIPSKYSRKISDRVGLGMVKERLRRLYMELERLPSMDFSEEFWIITELAEL